MNNFRENIIDLTNKLHSNTIEKNDFYYLKNIISSIIIIQNYQESIEENLKEPIFNFKFEYKKYLQKNEYNMQDRIEHFFMNCQLDSYERFFLSKPKLSMNEIFSEYQKLAELFAIPLIKTKKSILHFFSICMQTIYGIPVNIVNEIVFLIENDWTAVLPPLSIVSQKQFNLEQLKNYFFKDNPNFPLHFHIIPNIDRYFSLSAPHRTNHLFASKNLDLNIYESSQIIHELQHIHDSYYNKFITSFESEQSSIQAELDFIITHENKKKGIFCWLESNLYIPVILLKFELDNILSSAYDENNFTNICLKCGIKPIPLSPLFDWTAPAQLSVYCAAVLNIERNWRKYFNF